MKLTSAGLMTMVPLAGVVAGATGGGVLVDRLLRRTGSKRLSRCGVAATGLVLAALGSFAAMFASSPGPALGVLALGAAAIGLAAPATWAATMDLGGARSAASVMALANMAGNLALSSARWPLAPSSMHPAGAGTSCSSCSPASPSSAVAAGSSSIPNPLDRRAVFLSRIA